MLFSLNPHLKGEPAMKKALVVLLTLVLCLSLASVAFAATIKVPKSACFTFAGMPLVMTISTAGKVNTADGPVKFYTISGAFQGYRPIKGSGYLAGSVFKFDLTASVKYTGILWTDIIYGEWDLTANRVTDANVGEITWRYTADSIHDEAIYPLFWGDCITQHVN
jgi:hypothetical protein